jgi:hypothetical protein
MENLVSSRRSSEVGRAEVAKEYITCSKEHSINFIKL